MVVFYLYSSCILYKGRQYQHTNLIEKTNMMKGTEEERGISGLRTNGNLEKGA
ncbi:MAG: hypothetical protein XE11_1976 [Methanomicrobiales archaeon 53_19]|jgi:hypothetical protein|nr:MAG: hypothetical protein XE11_1976 [Methanomicrobiales archaeon 53_19]